MKKRAYLTAIMLAALAITACRGNSENGEKSGPASGTPPRVTFIELGSVNCIPCKAMQPIMKAIESKYGSQIEVIFYDVWKPEQKKYAAQYQIRLIPTQVFLDAGGKEFFRHEGFLAEEEIDKLLAGQGLKPLKEEDKA